MLSNVLSAIPQDISRDAWLQALPRALVVGFVKTDIEFQQKGTYKILFACLRLLCMIKLMFSFHMQGKLLEQQLHLFWLMDGLLLLHLLGIPVAY